MKKSGFTLAEVLITLGIIGVVAAMTIPTLIQNTNGVKFLSQYKKSISTLSQAGLMGMANYDTDYSTVSVSCSNGATDVLPGTVSICGILNSTLSGHQYLGTYNTGDKPVKNAIGQNYTFKGKTVFPSGFFIYSLADGSIVGVNKDTKDCSLSPGDLNFANLRNAVASTSTTSATSAGKLNQCIGFIDVNGIQAPNKEIECAETTTTFSTNPCALSSGANVGDVYPIIFHDGTVEPATNAARGALINQKKN